MTAPSTEPGSVQPGGGAPGGVTVTATARLARELRRRDDRTQLAAGRTVWPTPEILPFSAWLNVLWQDWLYGAGARNPVRLLRPAEERMIWERIVRGSAAGDGLLQWAATADAALEAWNLARTWRLPFEAPDWNDTADTEVFRGWAGEFMRRCEERRWLATADLPEFLAGRIEAGGLHVPGEIVLAGFVEWTPVQERLIAAARRAGSRVIAPEAENAAPGNRAVRLGFADEEAEIRRAAWWARGEAEALLAAGSPEPAIGVVVPDLAPRRARIERIFAEVLHPSAGLAPERDPERAFNISLGPALGRHPLVEAAFLILRSCSPEIPLEDAGKLLRSPFLGSAADEFTPRALLDRALRERREPVASLGEIARLARERGRPHGCPRLASILARWRRRLDARPPRQAPSDWAAWFSGLLRESGWPDAGRTLTGAEVQAVKAWNELLSELAGLDGAAGMVDGEDALGALARLAAVRQFQPESEPAPIQVLGVLEATGLAFDRLWIMGMHDGAWPRSGGPHPFLPLRLQRAFDLPQSSPGRELEFARLLTGRLLASAPVVVVSHPQREADTELRPSPLLRHLPPAAPEDLGAAAPRAAYADAVRLSARMEAIDEAAAPVGRVQSPASVRGGAAIFQEQAACPFRAFARFRLGAREPEAASPGLTHRDRGVLVHDALERVWREFGSHAGLASSPMERIAAVVRRSVAAAIEGLGAQRAILRQPRFAVLEQRRLEGLITTWLDFEMERRPFEVAQRETEQRVEVGGVPVTLRADRVDVLEDGSRVVIDYKSGLRRPSEWEGDRPDEPQLPLYAAYALPAGTTVGGVLFAVLKAGATGFRGVAAEEIAPGVAADPILPERIAGWRAVLERLGEDFRAGRAAVDPKGAETCRRCDLAALCRVQEAAPRGGGDEEAADEAGVAEPYA